MEEKNFQVAATLDKLTSLKDNTLKLVFHTQEVAPDMGAVIMRMCNQFGYLVFAPQRLTEITIPDLPRTTVVGKKSQSQRLRASLYKLWESEGQKGEFDDFYEKRMDHLIGWVQAQIDQDGF